jgi:hypothetical protein
MNFSSGFVTGLACALLLWLLIREWWQWQRRKADAVWVGVCRDYEKSLKQKRKGKRKK